MWLLENPEDHLATKLKQNTSLDFNKIKNTYQILKEELPKIKAGEHIFNQVALIPEDKHNKLRNQFLNVLKAETSKEALKEKYKILCELDYLK